MHTTTGRHCRVLCKCKTVAGAYLSCHSMVTYASDAATGILVTARVIHHITANAKRKHLQAIPPPGGLLFTTSRVSSSGPRVTFCIGGASWPIMVTVYGFFPPESITLTVSHVETCCFSTIMFSGANGTEG